MTQEAAIHSFWNSFNIPAYNSANVPKEAQYPYLTYSMAHGMWDDYSFPVVNIYYKGKELSKLNEKVREIAGTLKNGGTTIECDNGMLWIMAGTPFCNIITDATDNSVKIAVLNINIDYLAI